MAAYLGLRLDMTLAILSWKAHKTLINSLESYRKYGLDKLFDERIIFFQEISDDDKAIARDYGYESFGTSDNCGIARAYKSLIASSTKPYFLFLENDWELIEPAEQRIAEAIFGVYHVGVIHAARLRHRTNPGAPLWTRQFEGHEMDRPTHLLDSVHWTNPDRFNHINPLWFQYKGEKWYRTTAQYANWTNNPTLFRTDFLREHIFPRMGEGDVERDLQAWWEQQDWIKVAQGEGLFTHNRLDR